MSSRPSVSPLWATDANYIAGGDDWNGLPNKVQPPAGIVGQGFTPEDYVPAEFVNFELANHGEWLAYIDSILCATFFGDGSDGIAIADGTATVPGMSLSSGTYTLSRDVFFQDLTVSVLVRTNGFRLYVSDTCTINAGGVFSVNGGAGGNGTASSLTPGAAGVATPTGTLGNGGNGGLGIYAGLSGGVSIAGNAGQNSPDAYGGSGGRGGASSGQSPTAGGTASVPGPTAGSAHDFISLMTGAVFGLNSGSAVVYLGGGAGGSAGSVKGTNGNGASGGGGAGGGFMALWIHSLVIASTAVCFEAKGGPGGNGDTINTLFANAGGGGGGGGGNIALVAYTTLLPIGLSLSSFFDVSAGSEGVSIGPDINVAALPGSVGSVRTTILGTAGPSGGVVSEHNEEGIADFATGGSGQGFDYYDVTFESAYTDTSYIPQLTIVGADDTAGLPGFGARLLTTTGFRIRPDAQFVGSIRWSTKL